jgi:hypothetical protein
MTSERTHIRVVAALAGLFFVVAVVLMASAPWVLLQPDQQTRTELNRWFLTVAGCVDAIAAGVLLALALQPRRTLLFVEHAMAAIVAGTILPFQPSFAAILAIGVIPLIAYPHWSHVRTFCILVGWRVAPVAHPGLEHSADFFLLQTLSRWQYQVARSLDGVWQPTSRHEMWRSLAK